MRKKKKKFWKFEVLLNAWIKRLSALEQMTLTSSCRPSVWLGLLVYPSPRHSLLPYTSHIHNACQAPAGT